MQQLEPTGKTLAYWSRRHEIPGVFEDIDFLLFDLLLDQQNSDDAEGDLLEIGAFNGKSAIVLGSHQRAQDKFVVCDVFEDEGVDAANTSENQGSYVGVTRDRFSVNYRRYVAREPHIAQEWSSAIRQHVADRTIRFAHIDGGHLYDVVRDDLANSKHLATHDGLVVLDDYRAIHTPGVAAAVWEAVTGSGFTPCILTDAKFYGTWGGIDVAQHVQDVVDRWLAQRPSIHSGTQTVAGQRIRIIANPRIWTPRRVVKAGIPPILAERLLRRPAAFLGE